MWTCRSTRPAGARLARPRAPAAAFAGRAYARPARATFAASKADVAKTSAYQPASAKDAIERGLKEFKENKNYEEALRLFEASMKMKPNQDEALAAMYNMGCTYAKLKEWKKSADAIVSAINDHNLKLSVAIKDDDLRELRDRREWVDALTEVKGSLSRDMKIELKSEAKAPFRFSRIILFGGMSASAGVGLFITVLRLIRALQGGEGAPDLTETATNLAITGGGLALLVFLLRRDLKAKAKDVKKTSREDALSRLQIDLGNRRVLPLLGVRGQVRPVLVAGTKAHVEKCIKEAEKYYMTLRERGVSVIPIIYASDDLDPDEKLKRLKRELRKAEASSKGFGATEPEERRVTQAAGLGVIESDKRWRLEPYADDEWKEWLQEQKSFAGITADRANVFVQVQLDGSVRSSGLGAPNWEKLIEELPPLTDLRTTLTDGIGPGI